MNKKAAVLGAGVAFLLVGGLAGYLLGAGSAPARTTTVTTTPAAQDGYDQVLAAHEDQLLLFESKNASALFAEYEPGAATSWTGLTAQFQGRFSGSQNLTSLFVDWFRFAEAIRVTNLTQTATQAGPDWVVDSSFHLSSNSSLVGAIESDVRATDTYAQVGGSWLIANETWAFVHYKEQVPVGP